nr:MAG: nucleocapsid protein [Huangpi virus]
MAASKDLQSELDVLEKELTQAKAKYQAQLNSIGEEPDELELKTLRSREEAIAALEEKKKDIQQRIVQAAKASIRPKQPASDLDPDEHLTERSSLRYGNVIDLDDLDLDEPSGASADWLKIGMYLLSFPVAILLKALYMLTTRGRQTIKDNKGNRIKFRSSSSFDESGGVKVPRHLYVSLPTSQSSMKEDELTPGRYRTAVCGFFPGEARARKLVSPVMGVIGFNYLAEKWSDMIDDLMLQKNPFLPEDKMDPAKTSNGFYFVVRQDQLKSSVTDDYKKLHQQAQLAGCKLADQIESPLSPWIFAGSPDRCPPVCLYVAGLPELGAFFSILQDLRNTIMASKLVGTAEEKLKRKSTFYQSYMRRTQSMGVQLDQKIITVFMLTWGKTMVDHFHLGDDMDADLRRTCQALIDEKVKQVCNQEPLKL